MGYRDDRQMLIVKLRALEAELDRFKGTNQEELRREIDALRKDVKDARTRARSEEETLAQLGARLDALSARFGGTPTTAPPPTGTFWLLALATALTSALVAGLCVSTPCPRQTAAWAYSARPLSQAMDAELSEPVEFQVEIVDGSDRSDLPLSMNPSREEVRAVFAGMATDVTSCAAGEPGVTNVGVVFEGRTGRPMSVWIAGVTAEATRACIEEVLMGASLRPFQRDRFTVQYPYRF